VPAARALLAQLGLLQVVAVTTTVAQALLLAEIVARIVHGTTLSQLVTPLWLLVAVGTVRAVLSGSQEWLGARASARSRGQLRRLVLDAVRRLGPAWAARQPAGRLVTATGPGLESLDGYLTRAVPALVSASIVPAGVLVVIGWADLQSALILLVVLPLVPLFMVLVGITTQRRMAEQYATLARMAGHFLDLVSGLTTLKIYGQSRRHTETVRKATETYRERTMATLRVAFLSALILDLVATLSVAVVAVDVGLRLDHGHLDLRTALVVLLLAPELFAPLRAVGAQYHAAEEGRVAISAALDIVDEAASAGTTPATDDLDALEAAVAAGAAGDLHVRNLTVRYPGRDDPALRRVDLDVPAGQLLAIVGPSGGGKSTLLASLLGFVAPERGVIRLDGCPTGPDGDPVAWRRQLAWVPQRPRPTQPTVSDEVRLGNPTADDEQVAAVLADCAAPPGDTVLGEDGSAVSAGQRRRIALARAVLRARSVHAGGAHPVVILDEPSEDLDLTTEGVVAAVLSAMAGWATVVIVTHSDALTEVADRVVHVTDGRIVADVPGAAQRRAHPRVSGTPIAAAAELPIAPAAPGRAARIDLFSQRGRLGIAALFSAGTGIAGLALTATSVWLICRASQHPNVQALALAVVGVRAFALGRALGRYAERLFGHDAALHLLAEVRAKVFAALEPLAPAGLKEFRRGDLLRRFVADVDGAQEALVRAVIPATGAVATSLVAVLIAFALAPSAAAVLAVGLLVASALSPALTRVASGDAVGIAAAQGSRDDATAGVVDGLAELVAYEADTRAVQRVSALDEGCWHAGRRASAAAAAGNAVNGFAIAVTLPAVLAAGAVATHAGSLDPIAAGVLMACVLAGFDAASTLPAAFASWTRFQAGLRRVATLLERPAPIAEPAEPAAVPEGPHGLRAAAVSLRPAADAPLVLHDASAVVRPGERVALVGPSGCGKSTLLTAALRLLPVAAGRVELTGSGTTAVELPALASTDVPPLVAGSLQGDHVFNASLRDNVRVVRPEAADEQVMAALAAAGLAGFIGGLPDGWDTAAGPDGAALSGGQRQRLLLARALLADPDVLVLDEPTAHLDAATERAVLADLLTSTKGRTVLMSTHRRLEAGHFDAVLRIENERLADRVGG
jgi:ATP-binding cassette subfamily C protein CydCD